jgi:hypothetical protein
MERSASELGLLLCFGGADPAKKQKGDRRVESDRPPRLNVALPLATVVANALAYLPSAFPRAKVDPAVGFSGKCRKNLSNQIH